MSTVINQANGVKAWYDEANFIENKSTLSFYSNSTVSIIRSGMFAGCTNLTSISLPNVHTIGANAFQSCTGLTKVVLPKAYILGDNAFQGCTNLSEVAIFDPDNSQPKSGASFGTTAFQNCSALSTLYLGLLVPPVLPASTVFQSTPLQSSASAAGKIYVQNGLVAFYKTSDIWKANYLSSKISVGTYDFSNNNE